MKKTKIVAILTAFIITVAMTGITMAQVTDITPTDSTGAEDRSFEDYEAVYVIGQGPSGPGCVYVMADRQSWTWGDSLTGYVVKVPVTIQGLSLAGEPVMIWAGTDTVPGAYDLVLDTDCNDQFDPTDDVEDCAVTGFTIEVPEFATIAIPAVALLGLFLFFNHRKRREE